MNYTEWHMQCDVTTNATPRDFHSTARAEQMWLDVRHKKCGLRRRSHAKGALQKKKTGKKPSQSHLNAEGQKKTLKKILEYPPLETLCGKFFTN